ncbi:MAG: hydrogenase iron-sulfur subunit [Actinobacteria bacterium]|nr:hydrogenase iron-sulfur subunit [Actinomycetota bacterium]
MNFEPKIIGFLCYWCAYTGADLAGTSRLKYDPNVRIIKIMCTGRMDPSFVFKAYAEGADGVLICGCHPGECHYKEGNYKTMNKVPLLAKMMGQFGMEKERLRLEWVSAAEGEKFARVVTDFTIRLKEIGPLGYKELVRQ